MIGSASLVKLLTYLFANRNALLAGRRRSGVKGLMQTWVSATKIEF